VTDEAKKELLRDESAAVFLCLLKLEAEGMDPLYLVDNTEPITSNGVAYAPCAFKCVLPEQSDDGASRPCRIEIDNTDRRIAEIAAETVNVQVSVTASVVMAQNPDVIETGPLRFVLRNISVTKETAQAELYDFYVSDRNLPGLRYSPQDFPGLFA
jgi:hypothetical protein